MGKQYGMPYMGSKNNIAEKIVDILPRRSGRSAIRFVWWGRGYLTLCRFKR